MSGGTWNYKNEMMAKFLAEDIQDLQESSFYTDFSVLQGGGLGEMTDQTAEKKIEWMQAEIDRLQNAQMRMLKISAQSVRQAEAEARQAKQERDLCINQACTALKPLALLSVPPEGPIAHLNTGEEVTLDDIERAVRFVSRWRALMEAEE